MALGGIVANWMLVLFMSLGLVPVADAGWDSIPNREDYRGRTRSYVPAPIPNLYNPARPYKFPGESTIDAAIQTAMAGEGTIEQINPKGREPGGDRAFVYEVQTQHAKYEVRVKEREPGNYRSLGARVTFRFPRAQIIRPSQSTPEPRTVNISAKVITNVTGVGRRKIQERYLSEDELKKAEVEFGVEGLSFGKIWLGEIYPAYNYQERGGQKTLDADFLIEVRHNGRLAGYVVRNFRLLRQNIWNQDTRTWTIAPNHSVEAIKALVLYILPSEVMTNRYSLLDDEVVANCQEIVAQD
jgi:hypothetical protein